MSARTREKGLKRRNLIAVILSVMAVILIGGSISGFAKGPKRQESACKYYTSIAIERGDTLWGIASKYMTSEYGGAKEYIREVRALNHMDGDCIREGEYLMIPYYSDENCE